MWEENTFRSGRDQRRQRRRNLRVYAGVRHELRALGLPGSLPLCVLAKDGHQRSVAKQSFEELREKDEKELLAIALSFASLVMKEGSDMLWLDGEADMYESLLGDSWYYQKLVKKGEEKGIEKGIETMQAMVLDTIEIRFPSLLDLARKHITQLRDSAQLRQLHTTLLKAQSMEEAERHLHEALKNVSPKEDHKAE